MSRFLFGLLVLGGIVIYGYFSGANRDESGQIVSEGSLDAFAVKVGDCTIELDFSDAETQVFSSVKAVPCSEPHDNEFYASFDLTQEKFPGEDVISAFSEDQCLASFESSFGIAYEDSVLELGYMYPTAESWTQANDREVVCVVFHMDGEKLIGNAKGI